MAGSSCAPFQDFAEGVRGGGGDGDCRDDAGLKNAECEKRRAHVPDQRLESLANCAA